MRVLIAECDVTYTGRLNALLPRATRLIMVKADGSVLIHADGGSYKPLNWMIPPATITESVPQAPAVKHWVVRNTKTDDTLNINFFAIIFDQEFELGADPGLTKDGVEAHLQELLAKQLDLIGNGHTLVKREFPTAIGPVDILARSPIAGHTAVEIKRRGDIDGVEQLTRYLELLNRDPLLAPVRGVFAAQEIKPQARVLATDRGIQCVVLDYTAMRGDDSELRLF
jgi:RecB family endonuclease NucS